MKQLTTRILSFILVISTVFSLSVPAFAIDGESDTPNSIDEDYEYIIIDSVETPYGTAYYVQANDGIQAATVWDLVDIIMAGKSWADLLSNPSWANFGWAVLDTAALLPLLPSSAYFRQGGKVLLKVDEVAKFSKTSKGKTAIEAAMKGYKLASVTYDAAQLQKKFKHAIDFGITGNYSLAKAREFKTALMKVVNNATEIYKTQYHGDAIVYIKGQLGVITRLDGTFVSGWKLTAEQLQFHRNHLRIK